MGASGTISEKKFTYYFSNAKDEYERAFKTTKSDPPKRKKHALQAIDLFHTALKEMPPAMGRKERKTQHALAHEYLATLHLLVGELEFIAGNAVDAIKQYSEALKTNDEATKNHAQVKRKVLAFERLAVIAARVGKLDAAIVDIEWALDLAPKVDLKDQIEVLESAIFVYGKTGNEARVAKLKTQLEKLQGNAVFQEKKR